MGEPYFRAGIYFPPNRPYGRVWIKVRKGEAKRWFQQSVYGERLDTKEKCNELLNHLCQKVKDGTFHESKWGNDDTAIFENAWEAYLKTHPCGVLRSGDRNRIYRDFIEPYFKGRVMGDIEERHVRDWIAKIPEKYSAGTKLMIIRVLKAFFRADATTRKKMFEWPIITLPKTSPAWLEQEDQEKVLEFVLPQHRFIITFLLTYGRRVSEVAKLELANVDFRRKTIALRGTKNGTDQSLPMTPEIEMLLRQRKGISNMRYVFCTINGKPYFRQTVRGIWSKANKKANKVYGVPIVALKNGTRHSFITQKIHEGYTPSQIGAITGNTAVIIERNYAGELTMEKKLDVLTGPKSVHINQSTLRNPLI